MNRKCKLLVFGLIVAISAACLPVSSFAAVDPKDQWGEIPDGFSFDANSSGGQTVYAVPDPAHKRETQQKNPGGDDFNYTLEEFAALHLAETNRIREDHGLEPFKTDLVLTEMAMQRMKEYSPGHKRADGSEWYAIFDECDSCLKPTGENMSAAGASPESIARGFLTSEGHSANLLNPDAEYMGIGIKWVDTVVGPRIAVLQLFAK